MLTDEIEYKLLFMKLKFKLCYLPSFSKWRFFKKQSKAFSMSGNDLFNNKTELFVLEISLLAYSVLVSSVHLTNFAKLSLQGFSF